MSQHEKEVQIQSMAELQKVFDKYLLLKDRYVVKLMVAAVVSNQFKGDPTWMFLVAPSSGGKSEIIQAFDTIKINGERLVHSISDMTANAFASGQKKTGQETSLLHQLIYGGILSYKDFTSMVSKARESRTEIFKQMREIYDGKYDKKTGTGYNIEWEGKVGAIAGATEVIYEYQQDFATMGDRFVMYSMEQPARDEVLDFIMADERINLDKREMRLDIQNSTASYVEFIIGNMDEEEIKLHPDLKDNMKKVADFCTKVRSGVVVDERRPNIINFAPAAEMPMRMIGQLLNLAKSMIVMRNTEDGVESHRKDGFDILTEEEEKILYKVAFDSIPIKRRMALAALTTYGKGATTKGLATSINYQTPVVNAWLSQLNVLKICDREIKGGNQGDKWTLRKEYVDIMVKFKNIKVIDEELIDEEDEQEVLDDGWDQLQKQEMETEQYSLDGPQDF